jgi:hypothetical protein
MSSKDFDEPERIDLDRSVADVFSEQYQSQLDSRGLTSWENMPTSKKERFTDIDDFKDERMEVWHEMTAGVPARISEWIAQVKKDVERRKHPTINRIIDGLTENYVKAVFVSVDPAITVGLEVLDRVQDAAKWVKRQIVGCLEHLEESIFSRMASELVMKGNIGTSTFTSETMEVKQLLIEEGRSYFMEELREVKDELEERGGEVKERLSRVVDYFVSAAMYVLQDEVEVLENMYGP